MNTLAVRHWLALLGASWIPLLQAGDPPATGAPERTLSSEEARQYFKMVETLNPKFQGVDLFWQLQDRYGEQASYPVSEVITLVDPGALDKMVDQPMPPVPTGRRKAIPFGAFSHDEVKQYFAVLGEKDLAQGKTRVDRLGALYQKYGEQPWYTAREIRDIEKNLLRTVQLAAPSGVKPRPPTGWRPVFRGFHLSLIHI